MAQVQKPDFVFRQNVRVHLNRRERQFSRLLAGALCTSACRVCTARASLCSAVMWRLLVTHSISCFPFTSPPVPSHFNWTLPLLAASQPGRTQFSRKLFLCLNKYAMKTCVGSGGITTGFLVLGTIRRRMVCLRHTPLYPRRREGRIKLGINWEEASVFWLAGNVIPATWLFSQ
jgi:hypothetical protein